MKASLVVGLLLASTITVIGCSVPSSSAPQAIQSPARVATPSQAPYPVEQPGFPPFPPQQPTRRPPITRVMPTPPTPLSRTARITRDQAIAKALNNSPDTDFAGMQARGEITITATLTTWGDYSKRGAGPPTHPDLPVWVVKVETPPWSEWRGPVGNQVRVTWYGWGYVIDGLTGNTIDGFRIPD
jgi:hypothetical protein